MIRSFEAELPRATTLFNAYKKRPGDDERNIMVPHSFTFTRRDCVFTSHLKTIDRLL